jgi:uncharacterized protein YlzI (FlbEa/FlbD family)
MRPFVKFNGMDGEEVWFRPEVILTVRPSINGQPGTLLSLGSQGTWVVKESLSDVVKILDISSREQSDQKDR